MASPLMYAFNQAELNSLTFTPNAEKIVLSLCNLKKPDSDEAYMYMYAQAYDGDTPLEGGTNGCPVPPGWGPDVPPPDDLSALQTAPQFVLTKSDILEVLERNSYVGKYTAEVHAELVGEVINEELEVFIRVYAKDANGSVVLSIRADSYTPAVPA